MQLVTEVFIVLRHLDSGSCPEPLWVHRHFRGGRTLLLASVDACPALTPILGGADLRNERPGHILL